jgi:hypothetical protein
MPAGSDDLLVSTLVLDAEVVSVSSDGSKRAGRGGLVFPALNRSWSV